MFDKLPKDLLPILSDYAKILIPSLITYFVTRYKLTRPRKYEIRDKQFNLVYLPLYLLTNQLMDENHHGKNFDLYFRKVEKIIYKNYQYVFPKTIKLFTKLKNEWKNDNHNMYHLFNFKYQVESDYEKLKRDLGYPTSSFIDFFKRLNLVDKVLYVVVIFSVLFVFYCFSSSFIYFVNGNFFDSIFIFLTGSLGIFLIYLITYPTRH